MTTTPSLMLREQLEKILSDVRSANTMLDAHMSDGEIRMAKLELGAIAAKLDVLLNVGREGMDQPTSEIPVLYINLDSTVDIDGKKVQVLTEANVFVVLFDQDAMAGDHTRYAFALDIDRNPGHIEAIAGLVDAQIDLY